MRKDRSKQQLLEDVEVTSQIIDLFEALKAALAETSEQNQKRTQQAYEKEGEP